MKTRNIQVVLDLSLSMKGCVGMVYLFLQKFLQRLWELPNVKWSLQLTWFSGGQTQSVKFEKNQTYTEDDLEFLRVLRAQSLKKGRMTCAEDVQAGCRESMEQMEGEAGEQILLLFTDYCDRQEVLLTEGKGINRVFLFVPESGMMKYRFPMVNKTGKFQTAMPIIYWPLERLKRTAQEEEWDCLLGYLGEREED